MRCRDLGTAQRRQTAGARFPPFLALWRPSLREASTTEGSSQHPWSLCKGCAQGQRVEWGGDRVPEQLKGSTSGPFPARGLRLSYEGSSEMPWGHSLSLGLLPVGDLRALLLTQVIKVLMLTSCLSLPCCLWSSPPNDQEGRSAPGKPSKTTLRPGLSPLVWLKKARRLRWLPSSRGVGAFALFASQGVWG